MQDFRWDVRVRASGADGARVHVRAHQFDVGPPLQFDREYPRVTALEYLLGAVGADLVAGLRSLARKHRLDVDHVEASVQGVVNNPLTYLGVVGEHGHPGLEKLTVKVYVGTLSSQEEVDAVWRQVLERSPLVQTLRRAVELDLSWKIVM